MNFRGILITQRSEGGKVVEHAAELRELDDDILMPGAVAIAVEYSGLNYKDALALTGRPGILRTSPLIPGIDLVGTVETSNDPRWQAGDRVILTGDGIGESHHGGLAERAQVRGDALVRLPNTLTSQRAAAIGTAGFTAMLSMLALEDQGVTPDDGEVLVTGAAGGVGSIGIALLAGRGYRVTASTGRRAEQSGYLERLGASAIINRAELSEPGRPLQKHRWAGAVDTVGSATLANILAQTNYGGTVTTCGLAGGTDLPTTVFPFILRAVKLIGINSVETPRSQRERAWERLAAELDLDLLDELSMTIALAESFDRAENILAGHVRGRTVVDVRG